MNWLRDRRFWAGVAVTAAIGVVVPVSVIASGLYNMSALPEPDALEDTVGPWMLNRSRAHRAPNTVNPFADSPAAIAAGLEHFSANCLPCHGTPSAPAAEFAQGLHPNAPPLTVPRIQALSDGELFWTVKNGVRMTGMPGFAATHDDQDIWHIVAAVRHLSRLSPEQQQLMTAPSKGHHHGGSEGGKDTSSGSMDHGTTDHGTTDHGTTDHGGMDHGSMKPAGHDVADHQTSEAESGPTVRWYTDVEQATTQAKISSVPILANFSSSEDGDVSLTLTKEVFDTTAFKQWAAAHVVLLAVEHSPKKGQADEVMEKIKALESTYAVQRFPTVVLMTPEGKRIGQLGYVAGGTDAWIQAAEAILKH